MRSATTKFFIFISVLLIAFIIAMQVYWLNKTYKLEENEFNTSVMKAVRGVYEDMPLLYSSTLNMNNLVEKYRRNGFLFQVHNLPEKDSLANFLTMELEVFRVFTDCNVGLYNAQAGQYEYQFQIAAAANEKNKSRSIQLPEIRKGFNYVNLYFPERGPYLISQMKNWIFASIILLILLAGLVFFVYYFFKQKFLVEVQRDFINNVTHEFSTPLSVIEIATDGLEKPTLEIPSGKFRKYVESIRRQTDYLKTHISNLVNTVVTGRYQLRLKMKEVQPNDLLRKAVSQLEAYLHKKNGHITWQLEPENIIIPADEENIYLAFFNIINNAIKYSETPEINISTYLKEEYYNISIKDNGIGIDPKHKNKIFNKFYRVSTGNLHSTKGLGLGLYFTRNVIIGHSGTVQVNSTLGAGTEFLIKLPLKNKNGKNVYNIVG